MSTTAEINVKIGMDVAEIKRGVQSANSYLSDLGKNMQDVGGLVSGAIKSFGGFLAAEGIMKSFKGIIETNTDTMNGLKDALDAAKGGVSRMFGEMLNGDFSNFISDATKAGEAVKKYNEQLRDTELVQRELAIEDVAMRTKYIELTTKARGLTTTNPKEAEKLYQQALDIEEAFAQKKVDESKIELKNELDKVTGLTGLQEDFIQKYIKNYTIFSTELGAFSEDVKDIDAGIKRTMAESGETTLTAFEPGEIAKMKQKWSDVFGVPYDEAKESLKQLKLFTPTLQKEVFDLMMKAGEIQLESVQSTSRARSTVMRLEGKDAKELAKNYDELLKAKEKILFIDSEDNSHPFSIAHNNPIDQRYSSVATGMPNASKDIEAAFAPVTADNWNKATASAKDYFKSLKEGMRDGTKAGQMLSSALGQIGKAFGEMAAGQKGAFKDLISSMLQGINRILEMLFAEAAGKAIVNAMSPNPENIATGGLWGLGAAVVAMGAITALFAGLPKFANGGLVSGPTYAMVGEYAGASSNPEVIAPLSKLKDMLGNQNGDVTFRIQGNELVGILSKYNKKSLHI